MIVLIFNSLLVGGGVGGEKGEGGEERRFYSSLVIKLQSVCIQYFKI